MTYEFEIPVMNGTLILQIELTDFRYDEDEIFDLEWTAVSGVCFNKRARIALNDRTVQIRAKANFDDIQEACYAWARKEIKTNNKIEA